MTVLLLLAAVGVAYPFVIYPAVLWLLGHRARHNPPGQASDGPLPSFTVIIPAHNEERVIATKIANTLSAAKQTGAPFQIIVAADGCTDRTCEIVRDWRDVALVEVERREGIVGAFKAGLAVARNEVIFFSDADITVDLHTFKVMLRHFQDPQVGGVCGSTRMEFVPNSGLTLERINVAYRRWIRHRQSLVHSSIGADGANWALRRRFVQFPAKQLAEDLVMPLEVIHAGHRFVYEPAAGALERSPMSVRDEYCRKVRTIAGGMQAAVSCAWMFTRPHLATGFHYLSWKVCKYAVPAWIVLGIVGALAHGSLRPITMVVLAVTLGWAVCGRLARAVMHRPPAWLIAPWYAIIALAAPFAAVMMLVRRQADLRWRMAAR